MGRRALALTLALALCAVACGDDDGSASSTTSPTTTSVATTTTAAAGPFPVTVRGTEIPQQPERIVSLSATHTEILYAIGAGPSIVATDLFSDFPATANDTEKIDSFNLSVEAVATLDPDLVILAYDPGDAVSGLESLGIPALLFAPPGPTSMAEVYAEIVDVGLATGHRSSAESLVQEMKGEISSVTAEVPQLLRPFRYYVELGPDLYAAGAGSLIDSIMGMLGLVNVATTDDGPFPQFSAEALIEADPEYVFLADTVCCAEDGETFGARPGFNQISAVVNGNVILLDDSVASRWGPRLVDLIRTIASEVFGI
jgi:iron complex transport system substrate-binding protein